MDAPGYFGPDNGALNLDGSHLECPAGTVAQVNNTGCRIAYFGFGAGCHDDAQFLVDKLLVEQMEKM